MRTFLDTLTYILALYVAGQILTALKPVKVMIIKRLAAWAEKKYATEEQSGHKKKAWVLDMLRRLLMGTDDFTSSLIDSVVQAANDQNSVLAAKLKSDAAERTLATIAALKNVTMEQVSAKLTALKK